ncbi:MAG TPA: hypothetical protein VFG33_28775 [Kribbella sp.]|uniref:DUF1700 domain-containing protein n=1 Tax=Kribbella sp. TaxID=1871183 RepID=UPI002D76BDDF|nr:hypothetical protein [Kribbella sp.]HET6297412.1 hypothetical protein [Kribbella sp.]
MTTTETSDSYLSQVRAELADLPAMELDEVMDDITAHLTELRTELPTTELLEERLGSPQQYADQLRAAAGYPARPDGYGPTSRGAAAVGWLALSTAITPLLLICWFALDGESTTAVFGWLAVGLAPSAIGLLALHGHDPAIVTSTPVWRRNERRVRRLHSALPAGVQRDLVEVGQPVWWVLRGLIGGVALYGVLARTTDVPQLLAAAVVGALVSIWLNRLSQRNRRWLWLLIPLNSIAILALAILLIGGTSAWGHDGYNFSGVHSIH